MTKDILIAGLMVLGSVVSLGFIMSVIARAVREQPEAVKTRETASVLRPASGW